MLRDEMQRAKPTREECVRAAARAFLQIAIRLEIERREAAAARSSPTAVRLGMSDGPASVR